MTATLFSNADLLRLESLLIPLSEQGETMRPDEVQGFFTALASGPDPVEREFWWPLVLDDTVELTDQQHAELGALLEQLYQSVSAQLNAGETLLLMLYPDENDQLDFAPWCNAYLYALDLVDTDWFERANDEGFEDLLLPIMALGGMFAEEGQADLVSFSNAELAGFRELLPQVIAGVYRYWRAKLSTPKTLRRGAVKIGRNDRCPCGSGKKYKACCGGDG